MQRPTKQPNPKALNLLGSTYKDAKNANKLQFKAALLELSERDGMDYWRQFRDVWQYTPTLGRTPFAIVAAAHHVFGFSLQSPTEKQHEISNQLH